MARNEPIIGIDLGTTFSLVACADERGPRVLRDETGDARLPSVVGVRSAPGGPQITVGWEARNRAVEQPRDTVYSVKRLIGKGLDELGAAAAQLPYAVVRGPRGAVAVELGGRPYSPEEISALILRALRERAEKHFGRPVRKAVITVPAYFDDAQRQATRAAGEAAGLEVLRIVNEPTAAALAYGIGLRADPPRQPAQSMDGAARREPGRIALPQPKCHEDAPPASNFIADSSDTDPIQNPKSKIQNAETVAVYDLGGGTFDVSVLRIESGVFQVLSTAGDTQLGGDDFDRAIMDLVTREVREQFGVSIDSPRTKQGLRLLAEAVKIKLSDADRTELELDLGPGRAYRRTLTRGEFEALIAPFVERTLQLFGHALRDAKLRPEELDEIVFVGGSTRIPLVGQKVNERFGRTPYTALNPDEVVALGAAIQAAILSGDAPDMLLLDVIPLSLGVETMGGAMGKLIVRNTTVPCRATELFTTFVDGQTAIKFNVLQGERELAKDCRSLAEFVLRGVPPMPAGLPKVEVEFLIDANGILNVSAKELRSGRQASVQVVPNYGLTREEIDRIMRESVAFAQTDIDAHRRIDLQNQVEFDTNKTEQMLAQAGHLLDAAERRRIETDLAALRKLARETNDLDELHRALQAFGQSTLRLAELGIRAALMEKHEINR